MVKPTPAPKWVFFLGWWGQLILDDTTILITKDRNERPLHEAKEHFYQLFRRNEPLESDLWQETPFTITACSIQDKQVAITVERA